MMTKWNGNSSRVTGPLWGEFTVNGEFPSQRPVKRRFDVFFDLRLNKLLNKPSRRRWFETPSRSSSLRCDDLGYLWHHDVIKLTASVSPWYQQRSNLKVTNDHAGVMVHCKNTPQIISFINTFWATLYEQLTTLLTLNMLVRVRVYGWYSVVRWILTKTILLECV